MGKNESCEMKEEWVDGLKDVLNAFLSYGNLDFF